MAKATAKCTCSKCGSIFYVSAVKPNRSAADSWELWASQNYTVCRECREKEKEKETGILAEKSREIGLPVLAGTSKQCAWAEKIRMKFVEDSEKIVSDIVENQKSMDSETLQKSNKQLVLYQKVKNYILENAKKASWWISVVSYDAWTLVSTYYKEHKAEIKANGQNSETQKKLEESNRIVPQNVSSEKGIVTVRVSENKVFAIYPKDDDFRRVAKESGYLWDPSVRAWVAVHNAKSEPLKDRAADLISRLLLSGFIVSCDNAEVRKMAVSGRFSPHTNRWITLATQGTYAGWLSIDIPREENINLYAEAKKIRGSKYFSGCIMVPVSAYEFVEDFANIFSYKLSDGSQKAIAQYKKESSVYVAPPFSDSNFCVEEILNSPDNVLPDLVDKNETNQ